MIRDVRDGLTHVRDETGRLRAVGVSADGTAASIDKDARLRWATWERPEWIGFAVCAFYEAGAAS
ncbi:hypothetical protein [Streptomyces sp. NPDC093060]|uniref:hypothetical protein n=1 Tax=Streptomyces sp. NPDC093060 TaxID=3366019 RepID=UPI003827B838